MALQFTLHDTAQRMRQFYALTKPRVTMLAVFCAVICDYKWIIIEFIVNNDHNKSKIV